MGVPSDPERLKERDVNHHEHVRREAKPKTRITFARPPNTSDSTTSSTTSNILYPTLFDIMMDDDTKHWKHHLRGGKHVCTHDLGRVGSYLPSMGVVRRRKSPGIDGFCSLARKNKMNSEPHLRGSQAPCRRGETERLMLWSRYNYRRNIVLEFCTQARAHLPGTWLMMARKAAVVASSGRRQTWVLPCSDAVQAFLHM